MNKIYLPLVALCLSFLASPARAESQNDYFVNVNIGAFKNFTSFYNGIVFDYGAKFGANITRLEGFSRFATALAINRNSSNPAGEIRLSNLEVMVEPLFTEVSGGSFYFGPQVGFNFFGMGVNTTALFSYGALFGWMIPVTETLSVGPEVNITRFTRFGESQTALKLLVGANLAL